MDFKQQVATLGVSEGEVGDERTDQLLADPAATLSGFYGQIPEEGIPRILVELREGEATDLATGASHEHDAILCCARQHLVHGVLALLGKKRLLVNRSQPGAV